MKTFGNVAGHTGHALSDGPVITRADLVFGREMGPSVVASHDLAQAGAQAAKRAAAELAGIEVPVESGPASFDQALLEAGLGCKGAKQTVVDAFEIAYLTALMQVMTATSRAPRRKPASRATTCASCSSVTASRAATPTDAAAASAEPRTLADLRHRSRADRGDCPRAFPITCARARTAQTFAAAFGGGYFRTCLRSRC